MKYIHILTGIAALTALSLTSATQAATIISADFSSHGGSTTSIATASNITAGTGISSLGSSILPFADDVADKFEVAGDSANYAVVDERPDGNGGLTTSNYFTFDFTTSDALSVTGVSADINRIRASGNIHLADTMGDGTFDIYDGASLVGSLSTTYGLLGGGADKTVAYTGTAISLDASTTYTARFTSLAGGAPGTVGFQSFDVQGVIPEPGTYALLGGLLSLGYVMVRRR